MKKVLALSAAALLMTGVYAAESNVQVYGVIDAAVTGYKVKGQDAMLEFTSGFSMGNRIGIRGREDLGNGYSVGFDLEQGFLLDTGAQFNTWSKDGVVQNGAFNRQSYLDVTGPFGKIAFGRMVSLSGGTGDFNMAKWSPFGIGYGVASFIGYTSPEERSIQLQTVLSCIKKSKSKRKPIPYGYLKTAFELLLSLDNRKGLKEFFEKNSTDRDLRERMVKWCLEHKEEDYAQKILLEDVRNGGSIRSSDELNKILRRKNETDLLKEELLRRVQDNLKLEFTFFSELRELLPEAQWKSVVEEYISQTGSYRSLRMKLCGEIGEENKIKEIIEKQVENFAGSFCDKYSSVDIASQLALAEKLLKKTDPEYAKNLGKQMVKTLLRNPWKRGGYEALRQIVNGFLSASETKEFLEELVKTYPTRQAMREEFGCRRSERTRR